MAGIKGKSGGARPGAGRKAITNSVLKSRHTVYCTLSEFLCIKELLSELRRKDIAWTEVSKAKGQPSKYNAAIDQVARVEKSIKETLIGDLMQRAETALQANLLEFKKEEKEKEG